MVSVRNFAWDDLGAYARLVTEARSAEGGSAMSVGEAEENLRQPNLTPERDCFLAEAGDRPTGYLLVVPEMVIGRAVLEGAVRPEFRRRGIGAALMQRGLAHSAVLGAKAAHASATPGAVCTRRLLEDLGFHEASRQWQMRLEMTDLFRGKPVSGYELRHMQAGGEAVMTDLQNRAFTGSFGFAPNVPEEIAYRTRMGGAEPEDTLFLYSEGLPVAYCWTRRAGEGTRAAGVVWMIGADPAARGRGFGRAMLLESVDYLAAKGATAVELTVYQDNTPAVELYRATGFRDVGEIIWYERSIEGRPFPADR